MGPGVTADGFGSWRTAWHGCGGQEEGLRAKESVRGACFGDIWCSFV